MSELMKVSSTPHVRAKDSTARIMLTVVIALLPEAGFGVWHFGWKALLLILLTVATCVITEWLFCM
ncbi:MAG: RnfABCDGE type electron transport complex subunit D, partial [Lachnospiraceae bacterium]|nr:RnfABCDGE type electron transport complex subunit D [Lachnospiraceae bacterium]